MQIGDNTIKITPPSQIKAELDKVIVGQDDAKIVLSVAIYNHYKRIASNDINGVTFKKNNILMAGPSGCGKTEIVRTIAEMLNIPFYIADATSLTQAGYVGDDVETIIQGLLRRCGMDTKLAGYGIICLDECDKLAKRGANANITRDVGGEGVQQALLKVLEGSVVGVPVNGNRKHPDAELAYVDTKNILFIGLGAFVGLDSIVNRRNGVGGRKRISFESAPEKSVDVDNPLKYTTHDDLIKFGFIPEFAGRFNTITYVDSLEVDDLVRILKEPQNAILDQYKYMFSLDGIDLTFTKGAIETIAEIAKSMNVGARGLKTVVEDVLLEFMYKLPGTDVKSLKIDKKTVLRRLSDKYSFVKSKDDKKDGEDE